MAFTQRDLIAVQEAADLSAPLNTSVLPRWQRKALAAKVNAMENQGKTPKKGTGKTPNGKKTPGVRIIHFFFPLTYIFFFVRP